jgi:hypothetical protein
MTNEEMKKLVNYQMQIATFALAMQDEMATLNNEEWGEYAKRMLGVAYDMTLSVKLLLGQKTL